MRRAQAPHLTPTLPPFYIQNLRRVRSGFATLESSNKEKTIEQNLQIVFQKHDAKELPFLLLRHTLVVSKITQYSLSSRGVERRSDLLDTAAFRRLLCRSFLSPRNNNIITTKHCRSNK